ncbi:MAG: ATP-dependent RecD-like DNA helicase [Deltaproteobacteria bacterium]|nr:ATP-dependent RecD-like DNA helicase [Deltaproteobacteria bacterium]MBW2071729.1 ATP-dependent RecD-like DNA helicase [Deltaproteobacteria bacterium]
MLAELHGQIERITYIDEESGYTVARVKVHGRKELVTVVGELLSPAPGEIIRMKGKWVNHPRYGEQFKVMEYETEVPASVYGIEKYLGSGLIKGIGPVMARRIVERFGEKTLEVIENHIERLSEVEGIGAKRIDMISRAWVEQKDIRQVMVFLQSHGVSSAYASKIFKHYGKQSIKVVRENPYRLAADIFGIGFVTADRIAAKLGFAKESRVRVEAGILYVLNELAEEGHVYYPYELLIERCREILEVDRDAVVQGLGAAALTRKIVIEDLNKSLEEFRQNNKAVYLARFHFSESSVAGRLKRLLETPKSTRKIDPERAVHWVQQQLAITLAARQVEAVRYAVAEKILVITGGPGTGKTTVIKAIIQIFARMGVRILLAAPTGRAAKRMTEASGREAKTIHRLLEYSMQKGGFQKNEDNSLACDVLIVDEASMIDTILMHHLLKAIPAGATFILVGDVHQLPAVGAGDVLNDIIRSGRVKVVELTEIFRQAQESSIITNAHKINMGQLPSLQTPRGKLADFYFIEQEEPEEVLHIILELVKERIPNRFALDPVDDIQVLTPMHRGSIGAENLNRQLQQVLNPSEDMLLRGGKSIRLGDKVMQIRNNYYKDVFNGDVGRVVRVDSETQEVVVSIDGREVPYDYSDLDELVLAYAISVHKSQGSEYPAVVVPLLTQHYVMLQRNLIYTAVTRGKKLVVLVGSRKALALGVENDRVQKRYTCLKYRLAAA